MLATKITTHVADAFARFLQQYKIKPRFQLFLNSSGLTIDVSALSALLGVAVNEVQNLEEALFGINDGRQLTDGVTYQAVGKQLDGIGEIVGIGRGTKDDGTYVVFLLAKIASNFSDATIGDITRIASLLFQVDKLNAFTLPPAEFNIQIPDSTPLDPALFGDASNLLAASLGAGIGLGFISIYPAAGGFQLSGEIIGGYGPTDPAHGCGDLNAPGTGGGLAANIYNNPGA